MSSTQKPDPAVVVAVDGGGRGTGAVRFAIDEARARGIGVRMAHVLDDHGTAGCEIMDPEMTQACAAASDVDFDWLFGRGSRADELVAAAGPADLLVLGRAAPRDRPARVLVGAAADADVLITARHHRDLRHPFRLGPTPRAVLGASDTPVEVVPLTGAPATAPLVLERSGTFLKS